MTGGCLSVAIFRNCGEMRADRETEMNSVRVSASQANFSVEYGLKYGDTAKSYLFCPPGTDTYTVSGIGSDKEVNTMS